MVAVRSSWEAHLPERLRPMSEPPIMLTSELLLNLLFAIVNTFYGSLLCVLTEMGRAAPNQVTPLEVARYLLVSGAFLLS